MSTGTALFAVAIVAIGTYLSRGAIILLLAGRTLPAAVERALQNVGPAVLAALTINLAVGGGGGVSLELAEGAALLAAAGVAWRTKNLLWTLGAGMGTLWLFTLLT